MEGWDGVELGAVVSVSPRKDWQNQGPTLVQRPVGGVAKGQLNLKFLDGNSYLCL